MSIDEHINREIGVHGQQWNSLHDGYFSDSIIARPLVEAIIKYLTSSDTDVLIDLGGGTGFILSELISKGATKNINLVNMDCSTTQLEVTGGNGISCINSFISDFTRNNLVDSDKHLFFIMRSVLHYFGKEGLIPIFRHIRNQAHIGETFIHQTACFESLTEARCVNLLYQEMGTSKWYPTIKELLESMAMTKWQVIDTCMAPPLKLPAAELGHRYGLDSYALTKIFSKVTGGFGEIKNVFQRDENGFTAYLHYRICVSRAI